MAQGFIEINSELCKGCGFCVRYCPCSLLAIGRDFNSVGYTYAIQNEKEKCTGCGICALMCPDAAINVFRE